MAQGLGARGEPAAARARPRGFIYPVLAPPGPASPTLLRKPCPLRSWPCPGQLPAAAGGPWEARAPFPARASRTSSWQGLRPRAGPSESRQAWPLSPRGPPRPAPSLCGLTPRAPLQGWARVRGRFPRARAGAGAAQFLAPWSLPLIPDRGNVGQWGSSWAPSAPGEVEAPGTIRPHSRPPPRPGHRQPQCKQKWGVFLSSKLASTPVDGPGLFLSFSKCPHSSVTCRSMTDGEQSTF